jgi:hypothetical protein
VELFQHQYELQPDPGAGEQGVYTNHVKYASYDTKPKCDVDVHVWAERAWLGAEHPRRLIAQFHPLTVAVGEPWRKFDLSIKNPRDTRPEFRTTNPKDPLTGVFVDKWIWDPPLEAFALWLRRGAN